uniref:Coiled-coil domain containing 57 n=1 Tax=Rhinopithecus bieti TaxID=61621 RepID=A0A2K6MAB5_RHIBE
VEAEDQGELFLHLQPVARAPQTLSMHQLQRKLKEAARKILSLRLEKEQLIEMGNRLRAELGRPPHHALPPAPEARKPGEKPRRPLDRSPPLGQVQPHFTAKDAESAEDECPSGHLGKHRPRPAQVGSRFDALRGPKTQHSIHMVTGKSPQQKEDRSPKPPQAPKRPEEHGRQSHSSSSLASGALQDTWRLLDLGSSPSGLTSQGDSTPETGSHSGTQAGLALLDSSGPATLASQSAERTGMSPKPGLAWRGKLGEEHVAPGMRGRMNGGSSSVCKNTQHRPHWSLPRQPCSGIRTVLLSRKERTLLSCVSVPAPVLLALLLLSGQAVTDRAGHAGDVL